MSESAPESVRRAVSVVVAMVIGFTPVAAYHLGEMGFEGAALLLLALLLATSMVIREEVARR